MRATSILVTLSVVLALLCPVQLALADPHPPGTRNVHCTFNISFSGNNFKRHFWGQLQAWYNDNSPSQAYPLIELEGQATGRNPNGHTFTSELNLGDGRQNNFQVSQPWFDDSGTDLRMESEQHLHNYVIGTYDDHMQVDVLDSNGFPGNWIDSEYTHVVCDLGNNNNNNNNNGNPNNNGGNPHAVGDPSFSGFLGQHYQVHGTVDSVHNIVTAPNMQVNAFFVFLEQGACPQYPNAPYTNCWSHPGTYFGRMGFKTTANERLFVQSGPAKMGFTEVTLNNDRAVAVGDSIALGSLNVTRTTTHTMKVVTELMEFELENSDMFINLIEVRVFDLSELRRQRVHGLLGQTWRRRAGGQISVLEGIVDDYVEGANDLFGDDLVYNRFAVAVE